jgi:hypothetical protein
MVSDWIGALFIVRRTLTQDERKKTAPVKSFCPGAPLPGEAAVRQAS